MEEIICPRSDIDVAVLLYEVIKDFLKAIVLNSESWYIYQTYIKLGTCYKALENYDLAIKNLEKGKDLINKSVKDPKQNKNGL